MAPIDPEDQQAQERAPVPIAIVDVQYGTSRARAACIIAGKWTDEQPLEQETVDIENVAPYRPGAFFERELPCIRRVLSSMKSAFGAVIVDGYVELDGFGAPGLGAHLHQALDGRLPVVGVAKTAFRGSAFAAQVLRGGSSRPLFVTARGIAIADAQRLVRCMHGAHRIPTLLRAADHLARGL